MAIVPVSREIHGKMRLKPTLSFGFAKDTPVVRLLAGEVAMAGAAYPVVFIKENGVFAPFAVLGLALGENLFIGDDGRWLGMYIPAVLRRYPFMFARPTNGADAGDQVTLLVDDAYLSESEGELLFGPDEGEPTGPVAQAIQLLTGIELQGAQTATVVKSLTSYDLFDEMPLQIARAGATATNLTGMFTVSDAKLNALPDEAFLQLRRSGGLAMAHAQLMSLGQFARLQARISAKQTKSTALD